MIYTVNSNFNTILKKIKQNKNSLNYQLKMLVTFLNNKIQQKKRYNNYLPHNVYNQINKLV